MLKEKAGELLKETKLQHGANIYQPHIILQAGGLTQTKMNFETIFFFILCFLPKIRIRPPIFSPPVDIEKIMA